MITVIQNDRLSFSILVNIDNNIIHITQDRCRVWEKPLIYDMKWNINVVEIVRPIINKLMNRVGNKESKKIDLI